MKPLTTEEIYKKIKLHHSWLGLKKWIWTLVDPDNCKKFSDALENNTFDMQLKARADFSYQTISSLSFYDIDLSKSVWSHTELYRARFLSYIKLFKAICNNSQFLKCNLKRTFFDEALLNNSFFIDCHLTHNSFKNALLDSSSFLDCRCFNSDFTKAYLNNAILHYCTCSQLDFTSSILSNTIFNNCNFHQTIFKHTTFENTVFRNCVFKNTTLPELDDSKIKII